MWHGTIEEWFWYWLGGLHVMVMLSTRWQQKGQLSKAWRAVEELDRMRVAALLQGFDPVLSWERF